MNIDYIIETLSKDGDRSWLKKDVPMAEYTSFKAGGKVALLASPNNMAQLKQIIRYVNEIEIPFYIMGNGSNILVKDGGYPGIIIKLGKSLASIELEGDRIRAKAGALLKDISQFTLNNELKGFEFASGIPGSIGGAAYMNAGAYGGDMSGIVENVQVLNTETQEIGNLSVEEMAYGYRKSRLMEDKGIILSVTLKLDYGDKEGILSKMLEFKHRRGEKQPLDLPSVGSFFKRPEGNYAGTLIEKAGLKGTRVGGAMVSELHAGFLVNTGGATATEIIRLMEIVQSRVYEMSGVKLKPEVRIIGD